VGEKLRCGWLSAFVLGQQKIEKSSLPPGVPDIEERGLKYLTNHIPEEQDAQDASPTA
jgi:hypothetical protein